MVLVLVMEGLESFFDNAKKGIEIFKNGVESVEKGYGFIQNIIDKNENSNRKKQLSQLELVNSLIEGNLKLIKNLQKKREELGSWEAVEGHPFCSNDRNALHIIDSLKKKKPKMPKMPNR